MTNKLQIHKGLMLGEGKRAILIERVNSENIYIRLQSDFQRRIIPTQLILDLLPHLRNNKITLTDFSRQYRKDHNLPHLFSFLDLDYENFILGYEATISKICEYELTQHTDAIGLNLPTYIILPKPFILLSGISGTGKTRFVKKQALKSMGDASNYQLVPVRPDWHEPSDLLGYISRLGTNGTEYIVTDFLRFMVAAWQEAIESINNGDIIYNDQAVPYWLCLDEMNLAPVEQYFADYLSVIETRNWDDGVYTCAPLLNASIFSQVEDVDVLRSSLNLDGNDALWDYFLENGISIPPNLIVAGTVNMDETTHGFSRKVIDRALTLDFGEFFPNDYQHYFESTTQPKALSYPILSHVDKPDLVGYDKNGSQSIAFLESINVILKSTPFELAYRALNELLIAVVSFNPQDDISLQAVWDDFLMTKVLPRIEGDSEKLQDDGDKSLLSLLVTELELQLVDIWDAETRPDLLRENIDGSVINIPCRSKKKIAWMQQRLTDNSFTSFWP